MVAFAAESHANEWRDDLLRGHSRAMELFGADAMLADLDLSDRHVREALWRSLRVAALARAAVADCDFAGNPYDPDQLMRMIIQHPPLSYILELHLLWDRVEVAREGEGSPAA